MRGRVLAAAAIVALAASATGCSRGCTAIGWSNAIVVEAPTTVGGSAVAQLCVDDACSPLPGDAETPSMASVTRDGGGWRVSLFDMSAPDSVVVTVADADGAVLAERTVQLDWVRVGGSEECGGPHEARIDLTA